MGWAAHGMARVRIARRNTSTFQWGMRYDMARTQAELGLKF